MSIFFTVSRFLTASSHDFIFVFSLYSISAFASWYERFAYCKSDCVVKSATRLLTDDSFVHIKLCLDVTLAHRRAERAVGRLKLIIVTVCEEAVALELVLLFDRDLDRTLEALACILISL